MFSVKYLFSTLLLHKLLLWDKDPKIREGTANTCLSDPNVQKVGRGTDKKQNREALWGINYLGAELWNCFILPDLNIK